jgi:hypothetical protein
MTLHEIKKGRITDLKLRMESAMYDNWVGGDTILVKNVTITQAGDVSQLRPKIKNQYFTSDELELMERENILDEIKKDEWDVEVERLNDDFNDIQWLFRAKKS